MRFWINSNQIKLTRQTHNELWLLVSLISYFLESIFLIIHHTINVTWQEIHQIESKKKNIMKGWKKKPFTNVIKKYHNFFLKININKTVFN